MATPSLTAQRLREVLHYDPATGIFTWRVRTSRCVMIGDVAGRFNRNCYVRISVDGREHQAHRLAWLYMTGAWPPHEVDHKYGIRHDNRWSEIRPATRAQNAQNKREAQANNKCGLLGVREHGSGWEASIRTNGRSKYLGTFPTPELAHAAYLVEKSRLHPFQTLTETQ